MEGNEYDELLTCECCGTSYYYEDSDSMYPTHFCSMMCEEDEQNSMWDEDEEYWEE